MADSVRLFEVREGAKRQGDLKYVAKRVVGGAWLDFPSDDITVTTIGGGITNLLFKLDGPKEENPVLVRLYGKDTDILIDRERDNDLFEELATMGYAPPFHGCFGNGRVEGFLPARPLEPPEMGQCSPIDLVSLIAREMHRLHGLSVTKAGPPGRAEIGQILSKWLQLAKGLTFEDDAKASTVAALDLDWMIEEAEWVGQQLWPADASPDCGEVTGETSGNGHCLASAKDVKHGSDAAGAETQEGVSIETQTGATAAGGNGGRPITETNGKNDVEERAKKAKRFMSEVVLCHNDLLSGNILHADGWDRVQVIDFEYSGYNPRGFDIANHFCEHAGFDSNFGKSYPAHDTQRAFLKAYIRTASSTTTTDASQADANPGRGAAESSDGGSSGSSPCPDEEAFVEALRIEVDLWTLPSHLMWAAWAVVQARYSPIDFDFVDYARLRLAGYRLHKEAFFGE